MLARQFIHTFYDSALLLESTKIGAVIDRAYYVVVACQPEILNVRFCFVSVRHHVSHEPFRW